MKTLIVIVGPTAVGKTSLAIEVAKHFNTEIISADSRQFFKEMSIGTAKPSDTELQAVPHHFINSLSVTESYSVGDYERDTIKLLDQLFLKYDQVVLTGGSGLYINAVLNGFDDLPSVSEHVRDDLNTQLQESGIHSLQAELLEVDPVYYKEVDLANPQRIIRALEVYRSTSIPFSVLRKRKVSERSFNTIIVGLQLDRPVLYSQINNRVVQMMSAGLLQEVTDLYRFRHLNALRTVGYTEIFDYFDQKYSLERAVELIQQNTRNYAKRQLTWFRKTSGIKWYDPNDLSGIISEINQHIEAVNNS